MATGNESNLCSVCNKPPAKSFCTGCKKYFCRKDFKEHEQQLSIKFDDEIVRSHDEIFDQIQKLEKSNHSSLNLFNQIELWKKTTISKVEQAAEKAHDELMELIDKERIKIIKQIEPITREIRCLREEENFVEDDIDRLKQKINEIQQNLEKFIGKDTTKTIIIDNNEIDWNRLIYIREEQLINSSLSNLNLNVDAKWIQNGITVARENEGGRTTNVLGYPNGLCIDDDQTIYVTDSHNHHIVEWKCGATNGRVMVSNNQQGDRADPLNHPTDLIIDIKTDSLIICDYKNKRVVRWPRRNGSSGEAIIRNVGCYGLTMDDDGFLYVVDQDKHEVKQYRMEKSQGIVVAGGNGQGNRLDQLSNPRYVSVDQDHAVYISDSGNHRVMKWMKGAGKGITVAGGQDQGNSLTQLSNPAGIAVDQSGSVYVADCSNHRIIRWSQGATQGSVVVGGNGQGSHWNQLSDPVDLCFDREGNLYVSDSGNQRVQKFKIDRSWRLFEN
ncbi:unnamed protein product [Rotaria sp. Silwood2]|nr:unnamed protein product [Rotaria sp. Silwood2]CAF3083521.1 unnamed protein product [Rotaria sp. Silwood2]